MPELRYAQFCPLARAAEVLGHRWTLLVLRELMTGPQRFSDLLARLPGLSRSVLTERLADLEARQVVARRELPPPTAVTVYELTARGRALRPALLALTRWGLHFLEPPRPDDHTEPDWVPLAVETFARPGPTPPRRLELVAEDGRRRARVRVAGGPKGTHLLDADAPVEASLQGAVPVLLGLMAGAVPVRDAVAAGRVRLDGDLDAAAELPALFDADPEWIPEDAPQGVPS
ncbi:MAG: winged helix-turn-helix transcriptional regulator [Myxococcota bacterium]|nr:winged helix-turn-helix transcriptional regulator [Myxococcota bacterium]